METIRLHKPKGSINGAVHLPGSKSISNRVLMINALAGLKIDIQNLSDSDDTKHLEKALQSIAQKSSQVIDIGHAGTDMRFLTAFLASREGSYELTGSERMQERPIKELVDVLKQLGADISYKNKEGYPPLLISGKTLKGGTASIKGHVSSQFISALVLVAPYFEQGLQLQIEGNMVSKPYINMTVEMMKEFGAELTWQANTIRVNPVPYRYGQKKYSVESDWSAASYFYSLVALSPRGTTLTLQGLFEKSLQADAVSASLYRDLGVDTVAEEKGLVISKTGHAMVKHFNYNFEESPDIAQTLACTCAGLSIPFHFTGLQTLRVKETDRITALKNELQKFDLELIVSNDSVLLTRPSVGLGNKTVRISTYKDHRMAMSFAPLALAAESVEIEDAEVVSKSYPNFWIDLAHIGIVIKS
jgi:3-phosphoshikimate 1-carboxyvinyltransferase